MLSHATSQMKEDVARKAVMRLKFENKDKDSEVTDPDSKYFEDLEGYGAWDPLLDRARAPASFLRPLSTHALGRATAMHKYNYYQCFKCSKPYFGGEAVCGGAAQDSWNPEELVCPGACPQLHPAVDCCALCE